MDVVLSSMALAGCWWFLDFEGSSRAWALIGIFGRLAWVIVRLLQRIRKSLESGLMVGGVEGLGNN